MVKAAGTVWPPNLDLIDPNNPVFTSILMPAAPLNIFQTMPRVQYKKISQPVDHVQFDGAVENDYGTFRVSIMAPIQLVIEQFAVSPRVDPLICGISICASILPSIARAGQYTIEDLTGIAPGQWVEVATQIVRYGRTLSPIKLGCCRIGP